MPLPEFNEFGDLPEGNHRASLAVHDSARPRTESDPGADRISARPTGSAAGQQPAPRAGPRVGRLQGRGRTHATRGTWLPHPTGEPDAREGWLNQARGPR